MNMISVMCELDLEELQQQGCTIVEWLQRINSIQSTNVRELSALNRIYSLKPFNCCTFVLLQFFQAQFAHNTYHIHITAPLG